MIPWHLGRHYFMHPPPPPGSEKGHGGGNNVYQMIQMWIARTLFGNDDGLEVSDMDHIKRGHQSRTTTCFSHLTPLLILKFGAAHIKLLLLFD